MDPNYIEQDTPWWDPIWALDHPDYPFDSRVVDA
jgi:hypothetical protein